MICTSIQNKTYEQIVEILASPQIEMAEIRLDRCELTKEQIEDLFGNSDTPLVATCRINEVGEAAAERMLRIAIEAGARYADLEIEAPSSMSKEFQKLCLRNGTEIIRSYHNFTETPDDEILQKALARCFRYGADIAKLALQCNAPEDSARIEALYSIVLEDVPSLEGRLIAFGMGEIGKSSRIECLKRGAPFSYASLGEEDATAPGQWATEQMRQAVYGSFGGYHARELKIPASKSFAQRAIIAASLARGTSHLSGYSPCGDTDAAIEAARQIGADIRKDNDVLTIVGTGALAGSLETDCVNSGESGLLTRLLIPVMAAAGKGKFKVDGHGTLLRRPLGDAASIMAAYGVLLSNCGEKSERELYVPLEVKGNLVPGTAEVPGGGGSQLVSGLLMALPLCDSDSELYVNEPKSIPYMYITLDVLRHFGIKTRSEMEGDAQMLEAEDWSSCTGIRFKIKGAQRYHASDFAIEGDWSAAANFLVAGAIYGSAEVRGLDTRSLQADLGIIDILVDAGAVISQTEDDSVCVRKAPLEAIEKDLNNSPDLFPIVAVLASFCAGESRISGVGRLSAKESDRAASILEMLDKMGVEARTEGDDMFICGESLTSRLLNGRLLKGGEYSSHHDHRMAMALKVASIAASGPVIIDDEACVGKSFPDFSRVFASGL